MADEPKKLSQEEKELILKDTTAYAKQFSQQVQEGQEQPPVIEEQPRLQGQRSPRKKTRIQKEYDIESSRKNIKQYKDRDKLGYHRWYLKEPVKISTLVLFFLLILCGTGVLFRYFSMDMNRYTKPLIQNTQTVPIVCQNFKLTRQNIYQKDEKTIVTFLVKNNTESAVRINPNRIYLRDTTNSSFQLEGSASIGTTTLQPGEEVKIQVQYNTLDISNKYIECLMESGDQHCVCEISLQEDSGGQTHE